MKDSITFSILFPVGLALLALLLLQIFFLFPAEVRPRWVWYAALVCGLAALGGALSQSARLRQRLRALSAFLTVAPDRTDPTPLPALPVRKDDELGNIEHQLSRLLTAQSQYIQQLQDEKKDLEALLSTMAEGIVVVDLSGSIVRCNPAALSLFGLDPAEDWQGRPFHEFSRHPVLHQLLSADSAERVTQEIELEGRESRQLAVSVLRLSHPGEAGTTRASRGTANGYVLSCHDLTPIKQLESIRASFVANVSHELRTPLTAIKGYAETLLTGALQDPEHATRFLTIIDRHSERLSRLIDDLLTLSNLELGRAELHPKELFISELVQEAFDVVQEKAQRGHVTLSQHIPPALPAVRGDRDRLHQVLINLIDNAVKYTSAQGQVSVSAELHTPRDDTRDNEGASPAWWGRSAAAEQPRAAPATDATVAGGNRRQDWQDWLEIAISDTGCGIPETDIPRLTQRFYRVDKARSRELGGTGLGLAIVKHIVLAHGGDLRIESKVNHGTTVRVALPLTPLPSDRTAQTEPAQPAGSTVLTHPPAQ